MGPGRHEKIQLPEETASRGRLKQLISLSVDMCFLSLVDPLGLQGPSEESVPRRNSVPCQAQPPCLTAYLYMYIY